MQDILKIYNQAPKMMLTVWTTNPRLIQLLYSIYRICNSCTESIFYQNLMYSLVIYVCVHIDIIDTFVQRFVRKFSAQSTSQNLNNWPNIRIFLRIFCQTKNFPKPLNVLKPSTSYCTSTRQSVCERESKNNISHQWSDNFPWLCSDKVSARSWIVVKWHFTTCEKFVKLCRTQSFFLKILKNLKHQSSSFFSLKSCFFLLSFLSFFHSQQPLTP